MPKYTPIKLTQLSANESAAVDVINQNLDSIKENIDDSISRSAKTPSQLVADLDLNGHKILNLGRPVADTDVVRVQDVVENKAEIKQMYDQVMATGERILSAAEVTDEKVQEAADYAAASQNWATKMDGPVSGSDYSAKYYAEQIGDIADDISTVAGIASDVTAVAGNATNINAVNANKTNIDAVAEIASDVTTVAGISSNVTAVAGNATNINAVNANKTNIDAVASNSTNINAVNSNKTNLDTTATNISDINTCAANISDIADKANKTMDNLTDAGKSLIAGLAMPSDTYEDLTLGASGTEYTAPADGYVQIATEFSAGWVNACVKWNGTYYNVFQGIGSTTAYSWAVYFPVAKGMKWQFNWGSGNVNTSVSWFSYKFIYAKGSESEAS